MAGRLSRGADRGADRTAMGPQELVEACGRAAAALLGRLLGDNLAAVYLGGSGALGGVASDSDVDLVAVCDAAPSEEAGRAVIAALGELAMTWPLRGLEFVL